MCGATVQQSSSVVGSSQMEWTTYGWAPEVMSQSWISAGVPEVPRLSVMECSDILCKRGWGGCVWVLRGEKPVVGETGMCEPGGRRINRNLGWIGVKQAVGRQKNSQMALCFVGEWFDQQSSAREGGKGDGIGG